MQVILLHSIVTQILYNVKITRPMQLYLGPLYSSDQGPWPRAVTKGRDQGPWPRAVTKAFLALWLEEKWEPVQVHFTLLRVTKVYNGWKNDMESYMS
jgi:hypothetical protein